MCIEYRLPKDVISLIFYVNQALTIKIVVCYIFWVGKV
ncbi:hypothetical protein ECW_P2m0015 (plasmid) [Escherichia coli W]|uniref:Uncharacterized protein n=1 Tax=Escherichia coli (strain ATCC 9637 / CCM 2024 / DSM 1116 / LMG 11080 / NBRC 13500 / NCIMB 8666 / NRRL B-766 / W) TaxID=566546 RepID=A0A0H3F3W2_ECOLW|nr:hypothetical protein ECW_P2m0015 [Escherichia coli W]